MGDLKPSKRTGSSKEASEVKMVIENGWMKQQEPECG